MELRPGVYRAAQSNSVFATDMNERDILQQLLNPQVWGYLFQRFNSQWGRSGERYCDLLEKMANNADREKVADELQRVIWMRKEMELFFSYFPERLKQLSHAEVPVEQEQSRRGVL